MLGFADKVEGHFTAADKLAQAEAASSDLKTKLAKSEADLADLKGKLDLAEADNAVLRADLVAAKTTANTVIAAQGLDPALVPAANPAAASPAAGETAWDKYQRLLSENAREAGFFWAASSQQILSSRPRP